MKSALFNTVVTSQRDSIFLSPVLADSGVGISDFRFRYLHPFVDLTSSPSMQGTQTVCASTAKSLTDEQY